MKSTFLAAVLTVVLGAGFCGSAIAAEGSVTSTINRLYFYQGHSGLLVILNNMTDLGGCGNASWFLLPDNHVHYKQIIALLMTAQAQGASVNLTISNCTEGYGSIKHAMLLS